MKVAVCVALLFLFLEAEARLPVGSDAWMFCRGMEIQTFKETCGCMLYLKQKLANVSGYDPKKVDHWPVIDDRLYSKRDCVHEIEEVREYEIKKKAEKTNKPYRRKRKFYYSESLLWEFPILYAFHREVEYHDQKMIKFAIEHWENETCIRFELYNSAIHNNYEQRLYFTNKADGCYSYIGRQNAPDIFPQPINLETRGCTAWIGVPIHEIGHSLGLFHEQNRNDREFWVTFNKENVDPKLTSNFQVESFANNLNVMYDYGSVMQYDNKAFSKDGGIVLEPNLPYSEYTMGQRGFSSFFDSKIMNRAYCSNVCDTYPRLDCQHGGYMDPNNCHKCRCPEGLGGVTCETAAERHERCHPDFPVLLATDQINCLKSPGYDDDQFYPVGAKCNWIIKAKKGQRIRARFDGPFGVFCSGTEKRGPMCFHWVEVKYRKDKESRGGRFCCYQGHDTLWNSPGVIQSEDNMMIIHFDGSWPQASNKYTSIPGPRARRGFKLCFALHRAEDLEQGNPTDQWWYPSPEAKRQTGGATALLSATVCYVLPVVLACFPLFQY